MYKFGKRSKERLATCHKDLQTIANELIKIMDVTVLCGFRSKEDQNEAYDTGQSKLRYPKSKHNKQPSLAMDLAPYPIDWNDLKRFERMCGIVEGIAHEKGIKIRMGRDFSFNDYPHIELMEK
jgi:peptidoglycan L-alanyl-D-glutamate endopeptidase CwlK